MFLVEEVELAVGEIRFIPFVSGSGMIWEFFGGNMVHLDGSEVVDEGRVILIRLCIVHVWNPVTVPSLQLETRVFTEGRLKDGNIDVTSKPGCDVPATAQQAHEMTRTQCGEEALVAHGTDEISGQFDLQEMRYGVGPFDHGRSLAEVVLHKLPQGQVVLAVPFRLLMAPS